MINLTDILTKPVLSLSCSKCEGIVKTGIFNQNFKRLKYLVLFDNEEDLEDKVLSINSIYSNGENAIIIKDDQYLTPLLSSTNAQDKPSPINSKVYTFLGKFLGTVTDVVLNDKFFIHSIKLENCEILIEDIISCGQNTIIVQDENKKANISSLKKRKSNCVKIQDIKVSNSQKVYILNPNKTKPVSKQEDLNTKFDNLPQAIEIKENLNEDVDNLIDEGETLNSATAKTEENAQNSNQKPKIIYNLTEAPSQPGLVISNFEFLIGRKLDQNIYSSNNELIAKKNTKITTDTIIKARLFNKTRELVKFSH